MSHNSDNSLLPPTVGQKEFVEKMMSGSQRKTAFALRMNSERLIREDGLHCTGFLTLTVGDYLCSEHGKQVPNFRDHCPVCKKAGKAIKMAFVGVTEAAEASRRVNSLRAWLLTIFRRAIIVTERHKSSAIHFHLLGSLVNGANIRDGLDFEAVRRGDYRTASAALRAVWAACREKLPHYGFGRHELLPIRKTGEAVAAYISKYIEKNVCNRTPADKRKKLVRYLGWLKAQLKPNEFEWDGLRARAWRAKTAQIFHLSGCELREMEVNPPRRIIQDCVSAAGKIRPKMLDGSEIKKKFGARWAFTGTGIWTEIDGDNKLPFIEWDGRKMLKAQELLAEAQQKYEKKLIENFRWIKGLIFDEMTHTDEMTGKYEFWKNEPDYLNFDEVVADMAKNKI